METVEITLYQYSELGEKAKKKARYWYLEGEDFSFGWSNVQKDAKNIGLKLTGWDYGRYCEGELILDFSQVLANILSSHGETCETYKTAKEYQDKYLALNELEREDQDEDMRNKFLIAILYDYRIITDKDYECTISEESVSISIEANEYTFLSDGTRFDK